MKFLPYMLSMFVICFNPCTTRTCPLAAVESNRSRRNTKMPSNRPSLLQLLWSAVWTLDLVAVSCAPQFGYSEFGNQASRKRLRNLTRAIRSPMPNGLMKIGLIGGKTRLANKTHSMQFLQCVAPLTNVRIMHVSCTWQGRESTMAPVS